MAQSDVKTEHDMSRMSWTPRPPFTDEQSELKPTFESGTGQSQGSAALHPAVAWMPWDPGAGAGWTMQPGVQLPARANSTTTASLDRGSTLHALTYAAAAAGAGTGVFAPPTAAVEQCAIWTVQGSGTGKHAHGEDISVHDAVCACDNFSAAATARHATAASALASIVLASMRPKWVSEQDVGRVYVEPAKFKRAVHFNVRKSGRKKKELDPPDQPEEMKIDSWVPGRAPEFGAQFLNRATNKHAGVSCGWVIPTAEHSIHAPCLNGKDTLLSRVI